MNRRQRLEKAVGGGRPDRVPVCAWGHFYPEEITAAGLADAMVAFFERFDWDFMKIHARASYHVEGWGARYTQPTSRAEPPRCTFTPIDSVDAWRRIEPLPLDTPALAEQIEVVRRIRARIAADVPVIMTVFAPFEILDKLTDRNHRLLREHLAQDEAAVRHALAAIAGTFRRFVAALAAEGVDGLYFSTKWATDRKLPESAYARLARPYDLEVLDAARPMWCNILHLCESPVQLAAMADYPVQVFHWDARAPGNPSVGDGQAIAHRAVGGGVDSATLADGTPADVTARASDAIADTGGAGLILASGCSVQIARTPDANLHALRQAAGA